MIDHLEIQTLQLEHTQHFYTDVLAPLGYSLRIDGAAKGFGDGRSLDLFIREGAPSTDVHFAFAVRDRKTVDEVFELGRRNGHQLDRPPALAPAIHENYYAAYLRDPDGRLVEFVCQRAE